jgi:uncharacterized protein (DUF1330 family)
MRRPQPQGAAMPKGYLIAHITVHDAEAYKEYVRLDTPIFARYGARFVVRGGASEAVEGAPAQRCVVIEFPDYAAARACYESEEYQKVAPIRRANATTHLIVLAEGAD